MGRGEHPRQNHHKKIKTPITKTNDQPWNLRFVIWNLIKYILGVLEKYLKKLKLTGN